MISDINFHLMLESYRQVWKKHGDGHRQLTVLKAAGDLVLKL